MPYTKGGRRSLPYPQQRKRVDGPTPGPTPEQERTRAIEEAQGLVPSDHPPAADGIAEGYLSVCEEEVVPVTHGGARPGAGRKPVNAKPMVTRAFVITQNQDALITRRARNRGISKSEYLRQIIEAEHNRKRV